MMMGVQDNRDSDGRPQQPVYSFLLLSSDISSFTFFVLFFWRFSYKSPKARSNPVKAVDQLVTTDGRDELIMIIMWPWGDMGFMYLTHCNRFRLLWAMPFWTIMALGTKFIYLVNYTNGPSSGSARSWTGNFLACAELIEPIKNVSFQK